MSFISSTTSGTHQNVPKKSCNSVNCCSPSRLWKTVQQLMNEDRREEFKALCQDKTKLPHLVRVILTSRLSNNPLIHKNTTTIDSRLNEKFGKLSVTDLNALEITLLQHQHDTFAYWILLLLKKHATAAECKQFLNHQFGKQGNTALHLASFWEMSRLVRLMLALGADPFVQNNRQLKPVDYTSQKDLISLFNQKKASSSSSLLLKKAIQQQHVTEHDDFPDIIPHKSSSPSPPLSDYFMRPLDSFSSSSSSSASSFSSLEQYTPPHSPISFFDHLSLLPPSPPLTPIKQKKSEIKQTVNDLFDKVENSVLPIRSDSLKEKKVRFDPRVIMIDSCVRGDKKELIEWMDELNICEIKDVQNRSLLHIALMHGNEHLVDDLIHKVDINQPDHDGWTCLHYASALGLWKSLEKIASVTDCDIHSRTYHGLKVEDCPNSNVGRRRSIIDRIQKVNSNL
ncbi:hypothetical protein G6F16_012133 [Rhizopus arrhizus]|nr:hypothetical protein G6F24_001286 [Rhizopus arrhizus]KAG0795287.1 hypothetical protein G6F21_002218 [Rhizopus arrhizus]KAG0816968.1 hypothetical protein G6F20_002771 [Rhizopus arrhizus]KAG0821070.1 hypothetical protein G6F19_012125 [Rhizopus arrhizus]KAG0822042.1 hypothetical protein G6F18_011941 [Rhizopus arrhizus]